MRVLIADDDWRFRHFIRKLLETDPEVEIAGEASDGDDAVFLAKQLKPDVIFIDLDLPGLDGLEATRRIKSELRSTRVVILSFLNGEIYQRAAAKYGADLLLPKATQISRILAATRQGPADKRDKGAA